MRAYRSLVWAILIYVALDASVIAMPGAFAFDPEDCIDGHQTSVSRWALRSLVADIPNRESPSPVPQRIDHEIRQDPVASASPRDDRATIIRVFHGKLDPAPSEDPLSPASDDRL